MKRYSFKIDERQVEQLFLPIRNKKHVISLLMETLKVMLMNVSPDESSVSGEIVLVVSKMSRLFYFSEDKYFSIVFPYLVSETESGLTFSSNDIDDIDNRIVSNVLSVLSNTRKFTSDCALEFVDPIQEIADIRVRFWPFLLELLLFEDGYIRYDYDEANENAKQHPLNHYDVCYTSNSTFKIGLQTKINHESIIDFLQVETDCHFIETIT